MGRPLPGVELTLADGELVLDPASVPTFFLGYLGEGLEQAPGGRGRPATASAATSRAGCTSRAATTT